jgi:hypothetical protein
MYYKKHFVAGSNGVVAWQWQQGKRRISSGTATVSCTLKGSTVSKSVTFKVT